MPTDTLPSHLLILFLYLFQESSPVFAFNDFSFVKTSRCSDVCRVFVMACCLPVMDRMSPNGTGNVRCAVDQPLVGPNFVVVGDHLRQSLKFFWGTFRELSCSSIKRSLRAKIATTQPAMTILWQFLECKKNVRCKRPDEEGCHPVVCLPVCGEAHARCSLHGSLVHAVKWFPLPFDTRHFCFDTFRCWDISFSSSDIGSLLSLTLVKCVSLVKLQRSAHRGTRCFDVGTIFQSP